MTDKKHAFFAAARVALQTVEEEHRVEAAYMLAKFAILEACSDDVDGDKKAVNVSKMVRVCGLFADLVRDLPGDLVDFGTNAERRAHGN